MRARGVLLVFCVASFAFSSALNHGNPVTHFREAQVASTTEIFAREGVDLLHPRLNVMGDPGYFILELPIYQAIVAKLWNVFGWGDYWGRLVSYALWAVATWYLYRIAYMFSDARTALLTCFLFLFAPIALVYSRGIEIEAMSLCLNMGLLYHGAKFIQGGRKTDYVLALLFATLGFLQKLPNTGPLFLPLAALLWVRGGKGVRSLFSPAIIALAVIPLALALVWMNHADSVNRLSPLTVIHSVSQSKEFYFGTIQERLNPSTYFVICAKALENSFGSIALGSFVLLGLFQFKKYAFFSFYLLAFLMGVLCFTHLHYTHIHYMIPFLPAIVFFAAVGVLGCWDRLTFEGWKWRGLPSTQSWIRKSLAFFSAVLYLVSAARYLDYKGMIYYDEDVVHVANIIQKHILSECRIVIYWSRGTGGGTWDPRLMYMAGRRGITVYAESLKKPGEIQSLMARYGCEYLVLAGESLREIYNSGKRSNRLFDPRFDFSDLDCFSLRLTPEMERNIASLSPVYLSSRLRIYQTGSKIKGL